MKVILDTHALIWYFQGNTELSAGARAAIEHDENQKYVSHASIWETAIKVSLGRLKLDPGFDEFFRQILSRRGYFLLDGLVSHYKTLVLLPHHHRDPFDRLIIAQSVHEKMAIVTRDPDFKMYDVRLVW